jgi:hypothetical protein
MRVSGNVSDPLRRVLPVRRIAFVALAAVASLALLFTGAAWAPQIDITIINQTPHDEKFVVFQDRPDSFQPHRLRPRVHHKVDPGESFQAGGIEPESCVLVRVVHDAGDPNANCAGNPTPIDVRCDVSSRYACRVHRGEMKDVVVKVVQPGG